MVDVEQKRESRNIVSIIYGRKVILFPFESADLPHFIQLHREDREGYMQRYCLKNMTEEEATNFVKMLFYTGQIHCWSVYLKQNTLRREVADRRAGYIYITDVTSFSCQVSGIMDNYLMRGLIKHIRRGKMTYAEDTLRTLVRYLFFEVGLRRVETTVLATNRRALFLNKRVGFKVEGKLREAFHIDDKYVDVFYLAILKSEVDNE